MEHMARVLRMSQTWCLWRKALPICTMREGQWTNGLVIPPSIQFSQVSLFTVCLLSSFSVVQNDLCLEAVETPARKTVGVQIYCVTLHICTQVQLCVMLSFSAHLCTAWFCLSKPMALLWSSGLYRYELCVSVQHLCSLNNLVVL